MAITRNHKEDFAKEMFDNDKLESAIEWISASIRVEDVFDDDEITEWVSQNKAPEDVFEVNKLELWATNNGFVRE